LYPDSNLRTAKTRPALVVQADNLHTGLPQIVLAMISSQLRRAGHPSRVLVRLGSPAGKQSGLLRDSVVVTDNLATVLETTIERVIGSLPMTDIDRALRLTLAL
jgi:mRNA interferase MazF